MLRADDDRTREDAAGASRAPIAVRASRSEHRPADMPEHGARRCLPADRAPPTATSRCDEAARARCCTVSSPTRGRWCPVPESCTSARSGGGVRRRQHDASATSVRRERRRTDVDGPPTPALDSTRGAAMAPEATELHSGKHRQQRRKKPQYQRGAFATPGSSHGLASFGALPGRARGRDVDGRATRDATQEAGKMSSGLIAQRLGRPRATKRCDGLRTSHDTGTRGLGERVTAPERAVWPRF
jgi:hypothetical protein